MNHILRWGKSFCHLMKKSTAFLRCSEDLSVGTGEGLLGYLSRVESGRVRRQNKQGRDALPGTHENITWVINLKIYTCFYKTLLSKGSSLWGEKAKQGYTLLLGVCEGGSLQRQEMIERTRELKIHWSSTLVQAWWFTHSSLATSFCLSAFTVLLRDSWCWSTASPDIIIGWGWTHEIPNPHHTCIYFPIPAKLSHL